VKAAIIGLSLLFCTIRSQGATDVPQDVRAADLLEQDFGRQRVRVSGKVVDACPDEVDAGWTHLVLDSEGTILYLAVEEPIDRTRLSGLIGAHISAVGHCVLGHTGGRLVKSTFYVSSTNDLSVITTPVAVRHTAETDLADYNFPVHSQSAQTARVRAEGTVIAAWDGSKVLIRTDDGKIVKGELVQPDLPVCGRRIHLTGLPETDLYNIILTRASWTDISGTSPVAEPATSVSPARLQRNEADIPRYDFSFHGKAVRLVGTVCGMPVRNGDGRFYLESDGRIVTVDVGTNPDAAATLGIGYQIEICGTCVMETEKMGYGRLFTHITGYRIVLRSPADIRILAAPPWWTTTRLSAVIAALLLALAGIFVWNRTLRRVVDRRSRELLREKLAHVESELKIGERTRLSVELHDTLSQNLTGTALEINTAEELVREDAEEAIRHLKIASKTLKSSRDELRNCLWDLRSQALEERDMNAAIRKTLEPYIKDLDLQVRFNVPRALFTDNTAHALMRIIRELVLNAIRHGHATAIKIAGSRENGQLLFSVRDNGTGFDPATAPGVVQGHFGLQGIRERLRLLKGRLTVESRPGAGAKATAQFELPKAGEGKA